MTLRKLKVDPDKTGYSVRFDGDALEAAQKTSPASQFGSLPEGAARRVQVTWLVGPGEYRYLWAFYRTATGRGSLPFLVDLAVDEAALVEHVAVIEPATFKLSGVKGQELTVKATVLVTRWPTFSGAARDAAMALLFENYAGSGAQTLASLDDLVNEDLPGSIGG